MSGGTEKARGTPDQVISYRYRYDRVQRTLRRDRRTGRAGREPGGRQGPGRTQPRKENAELAMERDVFKRSAALWLSG
jgi:hypothetical protein